MCNENGRYSADLIVEVPVDRLLEVCNPTIETAWGFEISPDEIEKAVLEGRLQPDAWDMSKHMTEEEELRYHIERIAYFVVYGWSDPIDIDVGVPSLGCYIDWVIQDGNHRFYAAIIRGYKIIRSVLSGELGHARKLLGVPVLD